MTTREAIKHLLTTLPRRHSLLLMLYADERNLTPAEMGKIVGGTQEQVAAHLGRALRAVKRAKLACSG